MLSKSGISLRKDTPRNPKIKNCNFFFIKYIYNIVFGIVNIIILMLLNFMIINSFLSFASMIKKDDKYEQNFKHFLT